MSACFGIDTATIVRLAAGDPEDSFETCVRKLPALVERDDAEVFASNQVVGEAYIVLQHHYGVSKTDARAALAADSGCSLLDRLITDDNRRAELTTLTLDRKMASLRQVRRL